MKNFKKFITRYKKDILICLISALASFCMCYTITAIYQTYKLHQKISDLNETLDQSQREFAIMQLSELRGRARAITLLSYGDTDEAELKEAISDIYSWVEEDAGIFHSNPYLIDFEFVSKPNNTSNVEDICEKIMSQIDSQIETIRSGS